MTDSESGNSFATLAGVESVTVRGLALGQRVIV